MLKDKFLLSTYISLRRWWRSIGYNQRRWIFLFLAAAIYAAVVLSPLPGVSPEGKQAIAVFGVAAFLWGTSALPLAVTGILILFLLPFSGALSAESTYAHFGNRAVFFILGAFILSSPIMRSGLSTRVALGVVTRFGRSLRTLLASILLLAAILSCFISAHAVAAMLFPIILEVVRAAGAKPGSRFGLAAFLSMAWGVVIGSNTTLLGGARGPLALGILQGTTGDNIGFVEWTVWMFPIVIVLLVVAFAILQRIDAGEDISLVSAREFLQVRNEQLGQISRREVATGGIMVLTILLWIFQGDEWGLDVVAFLGVSLAFILGIAKWREVEEDVNWGVFLMYGSAIPLSTALEETGAAQVITQNVLSADLASPLPIFMGIVLLATLLTEFMSNSAAVAVLMPVALAIAQKYGIDPRTITMGVVLPAGLSFMLPVSTPAIAISISSGYVRPFDVFRWGVWLDVLGYLGVFLISQLYWPLVGLGKIG
ncbi:DASS family sodium-coupled anion symporter [Geitlerinema sp. PCC 9228]|jgi:sodium-dependent dicarboxylate transporter 2/3/5|uniref:SLC13 family permease n=1 Tax=Geitlerinema sp. PCC 9228 TaxID=111611 RepID=UPI0008F9D000|nr:DASS family sodium-coupled anion symporter [Geitlerinema sp. PCC 9228]